MVKIPRLASTIYNVGTDRAQLFHSCAIRYPLLRLRGYAAVNPLLTAWWHNPSWRIRGVMDHIMRSIGRHHFNVMLEHGCGTRKNTTPALRSFADQVWGVDIIPSNRVVGIDRYIRVDLSRSDRLSEIADASVDAICVLNYTGFHPHSTWRLYFSPTNDRLAPYMNEENFLRVLRPGGYLIAAEWEARPEARWAKTPLPELLARAADSYDPPELKNFTLLSCGFALGGPCPFVAYQLR